MSAQLKLTGIPQSVNDEIYNPQKGILGNVLKGIGKLFSGENTIYVQLINKKMLRRITKSAQKKKEYS